MLETMNWQKSNSSMMMRKSGALGLFMARQDRKRLLRG